MSNQRKSNLFTQVPGPHVKRSLFDLSHEVKMSGKFGYLYPVLCIECLPGDNIRETMNVMLRMAPMLAPILHRIDVTTHFFKVPCRILTDHWEDFITGGQDGTAAPILPYVTPAALGAESYPGHMGVGTLWDYLGLPPAPDAQPGAISTQQISVLPFRACAKIWNDYYRDPNLQDEMELDLDLQGNVTTATVASNIMDLYRYRRAFEKDYFTSALPWAQRGAQVLMPLSGVAEAGDIDYKPVSTWFNQTGAANVGPLTTGMVSAGGGNVALQDPDISSLMRVENIEGITFDNAATTINDFRRALAIQKWLEANARGGARYVEQIQGHFAVTVPDYRLQRAEYLGGGRQPVSISEVMATAETGEEATPARVNVGDMKGHGISVGRTNSFSYRCQEHGFIVGFLSVTMRTAYSQGIAKMWQRADKYDYAWPELANLGEQEIKGKEVFYSYTAGDDDENDALFGYIPRYAEYKFHNDRIAGDFRTTLGFWHLGRKFITRPVLDKGFTSIFEDGNDVEEGHEEESFRRIFAVQEDADYLWMQLYHHLTAQRPLPYFGVPTI